MFRLDGKVALVTGASRGIGKAIADTFADLGAHIVVNYVKGEDAARGVADGIVGRGGSAEILGFDVADTARTEAAIEGLVKSRGKLDILVANAGISIDNLLLRVTDLELDTLWATNVRGAITCARLAVRPMMRARQGRIIFVSSVVGETGNVGQTAYAATKAALLGVTKSVAREYASRNITVNAVTPGFIETEMTDKLPSVPKEAMLKAIPLGRAGTAAEVAAACAFLASDEAAYVTGHALRVNGGMYV